MSTKIILAGVASGFACLLPLTALAQAAAAAATPASAADSGDVTRVVITAQKRREDIRDVPLSVSVLSSEQLGASQIGNVEDLTRNVPNISFTSQGGPGLGTIEIRGVSSQAGSATVSVYLDDVSLTTRNLYSAGSAEPRFFDIDHVEVLRGPQGTLYGASSLGGTIKFIGKQPDLKTFSGNAKATASFTQDGGANYEAEGVLNIPLVKNAIGLRIGVQHGHDSGYIDQVDPVTLRVVSRNIDDVNWNAVKVALKADFGNSWSLTPALFAQQTNTGDIDAAYLTVGDYQGAPAQTSAPLGRFQTSKIVREPGHDRLSVPSVTLAGETALGSFTGVLSGYQRRFDRIQDGTAVNSSYLGGETHDADHPITNPNPALGDIVAALPSEVQLRNQIDQTSLELRLASKDYDPAGHHPFTWIGGVFVADAVTQVYDSEPVFGINAAFAAAGENANDPADLAGTFPGAFLAGDNSYYSARHYHDKQSSVFGEGTWHITPKIAATAGLRYLYATQHFTREGDFYFNSNQPPKPPIDIKSTASTPSFKLNWAVDPSTSLYGNVSKGFRLGSANRPIPDNAIVEADLASLGLPGKPPASLGPDSLWSYEVGSKSVLWNGALAFNVAAFYLDWKDLQQDVTLPQSGFDFETNTGKAHSYGLELDVRGRVSNNLTLLASGGFTHASFTEDVVALGTGDDGLYNVRKGDRILGVPKASANLGFDYHWAVADAAGAFVRGNGQWTGASKGSLFRGDSDYGRASYFTVDASAGVNFDKWEITAFVKNLNNNQTVIQRPSVQFVSEAYYLRPRTIGVTAAYDF